ncbi:hypothetical protein HID58_069347 [Brassica napus]|uniref:DELLA protein n=1 Tax=Brassica napus TaxID=3708 RepID=A0ABQ7YVP2_BRANA|nr:hypothetical protein HID58_069347 [Brassica napus]
MASYNMRYKFLVFNGYYKQKECEEALSSRGERSQRDVFRVRESTHNRHETSNDRKEPTTSTVMATNVLEGQPEAKVCMELVVVEDGLNLVNEILEQVLNVLKDDGMNLDETIDRLGENTGYDLVDEGPQGVKMDEKETYFSKECKVVTATAPMANAYANATVLEKIENLAATFRHRKCNETSSRFFFLNIKGNDKSYQTPHAAHWLLLFVPLGHIRAGNRPATDSALFLYQTSYATSSSDKNESIFIRL